MRLKPSFSHVRSNVRSDVIIVSLPSDRFGVVTGALGELLRGERARRRGRIRGAACTGPTVGGDLGDDLEHEAGFLSALRPDDRSRIFVLRALVIARAPHRRVRLCRVETMILECGQELVGLRRAGSMEAIDYL